MKFTVKGSCGIEITVEQAGALYTWRLPSGYGGAYSSLEEVMAYLTESGRA